MNESDIGLGLLVSLSSIVSAAVAAGLTYYGTLLRFRNRISNHEAAVDTRFDALERKVTRINKRSAMSLRILLDIANKEGVLNRVTDQVSDLLLEDDEE